MCECVECVECAECVEWSAMARDDNKGLGGQWPGVYRVYPVWCVLCVRAPDARNARRGRGFGGKSPVNFTGFGSRQGARAASPKERAGTDKLDAMGGPRGGCRSRRAGWVW